jgi:hypothetical protein
VKKVITIKGARNIWYTTPDENDRVEWGYIFSPSFAERTQSEELSSQDADISGLYARTSWSNDRGKYTVSLSVYPYKQPSIGTYRTQAQALTAARAASWRYAQVMYKTDLWREISGRPEQIVQLKWPGGVAEHRNQAMHHYSVMLGKRGAHK